MKTTRKILMLLTTLMISSCDKYIFMDETNGVKVINRSTDDIYTLCSILNRPYSFKKSEVLDADSLSYETILIKGKGKKTAREWAGPSAEKVMKSTDTISLFILSKEEYEGKSWSQLVDSGQFLQVYHLSGDDIRRLGSCVPFPPTKEMCDMVMEPACQE